MAAATSVVVLDRGNNTTCTVNLHGLYWKKIRQRGRQTFHLNSRRFLLNVIEKSHGKCSYKKNRVHFFYMDFFVVMGVSWIFVCVCTIAPRMMLMRFFFVSRSSACIFSGSWCLIFAETGVMGPISRKWDRNLGTISNRTVILTMGNDFLMTAYKNRSVPLNRTSLLNNNYHDFLDTWAKV